MKKKLLFALPVLAFTLGACQVQSKPLSVKEFKGIFDENIAVKRVNELKDGRNVSISKKYRNLETMVYTVDSYELDTANADQFKETTWKKAYSISAKHTYRYYNVTQNEDGTYTDVEDTNKKFSESVTYEIKKVDGEYQKSGELEDFYQEIVYASVSHELKVQFNSLLDRIGNALNETNAKTEIMKTSNNYLFRIQNDGGYIENIISQSEYSLDTVNERSYLDRQIATQYTLSGF